MICRIAFPLLALAMASGCGGKDATSPGGSGMVPGSPARPPPPGR